ncbi:MAG TPA: hypothetical protein VGH37_12185 [Candidatus Acidoferrum sp.]|jgi:hypothetical protein
MELAAIHQARALAFVEPIDFNPQGKAFYPDLVEAIAGRYSFQKFPQKPEELDESKGIAFALGKLGGTAIEELIIYTHGLLLGTRVSTQESRRLLEEAIQWGVKDLGLVSRPISRWQYASQLTFYSKFSLTTIHPAVERLADSTAKVVNEIVGENLTYELTGILIDYDQLKRKHPLGRFSIQRRDNTPFSENKYFSDAPLPTDVHIKLLEEFEATISRK